MLQQKRTIDVPSARSTLNTVRISIPEGNGIGDRPRFEKTFVKKSCGNPIASCAIPYSHEQSLYADVLIQFVPMNPCSIAGEFELLTLLRCSGK